MQNKNQQPTFLLKNINAEALYKQYQSGHFNRPIPEKTKLNQQTKKLQNLKNIAINHDKINQVQFVITNKESVEHFLKDGVVKGGRCEYCHFDFDSDRIGYPLHYDCHHHVDDHIHHIKHLFWNEGCFCSYECCLSYVKHFKIKKDHLIHDVEMMLRLMYKLDCKTDDVLQETNDPKLLTIHGGPLKETEWRSKTSKYIRTSNVIKIPAQIVYNKV